MTAPVCWRCRRCGQTFSQWAPAQRHANENHHGGLEVILDELKEPTERP